MLSKRITEKEWKKINYSTCYLCNHISKITEKEKDNFIPPSSSQIVFYVDTKQYWLWQRMEQRDEIRFCQCEEPILQINYCPICGRDLYAE